MAISNFFESLSDLLLFLESTKYDTQMESENEFQSLGVLRLKNMSITTSVNF